MQEQAQSQAKVVPWLQKHGLDKLARLWQKIQIEPGWQIAVEAAMRDRVAALEVVNLEMISKLISDVPPGKAAFYAVHDSASAAVPLANEQALVKQVRSADSRLASVLADWLAHFYCAASVEDAIKRAKHAPPGCVFVTAQGHQVTRSGIQFYAAESAQEGMLARQNELDSLAKEQRAQQLLADEERSTVTLLESAAAAALAAFNQIRASHAEDLRYLGQVRVEAERLEQMAARSADSAAQLDAQLSETQAELEALHEEEQTLAAQFESHDAELAGSQQTMEDKRENLIQATGKLETARNRVRELERRLQEASFEARSAIARREQMIETDKTSAQLLAQAATQVGALQMQLGQLNHSSSQAGLQSALEARVATETGLAQARNAVEAANQRLRQAEEKRLELERAQEPLRAKVGELQLKEQAARMNIEQYTEQLTLAEIDEQAQQQIRAAFEVLPKIGFLQSELARLNSAISSLGPVNLAALDELTQSKERQQFLQTQLADLNEAIATLEDAIKKIDIETRDLLQETFDKVNLQFNTLFPKLFGGGEAKLVMTGDEILNAGVQVMAQPPGKKNATIHLLSGGEKALTAIALVFAIFHLNPAPFCLLDEVDAPLDDANTERYAAMVKSMALQTQFVFISHNKIAMEMAQQLIGVTMQERGVSRIVAVDLEDASRMLEAA
jgi:chromosome segregation protein